LRRYQKRGPMLTRSKKLIRVMDNKRAHHVQLNPGPTEPSL
jgi:hypothetical protein